MPASVDLDTLLSRALASLAERPALSAADMKPLKKHMGVLHERFRAKGFEVTAKTVRAPLERQLVELVAQGPTPFKGIEKRVQGATGAEVKVALAALVRDGAVVEALRPAGRYLLAPQGRVATLSQDEQRVVLASLARATGTGVPVGLGIFCSAQASDDSSCSRHLASRRGAGAQCR
jgi:hypothetical protein